MKNPKCPVCQKESCVHKVSLLYMIGISEQKDLTPENLELFNRIYSIKDSEGNSRRPARAEMREAIKRFAPPSGKDRVIRPVNPDLAVLAMLIFGIIFLVNIYTQQAAYFPYALGILLVFLLGYAVLRRRIIGKFQNELQSTTNERKVVEKAVDRWMKLYYCETDEIVFDPNRNRSIPLMFMQEYILTGQVSNLQE